MFKKLDEMEVQYNQLENQVKNLSEHFSTDQKTQILKEYSSLSKIISIYREYKKVKSNMEYHKTLMKQEISDKEMVVLIKEELIQLQKKEENLFKELKSVLLPVDPLDEKNAIMEFRQASGGDESALFCKELFVLYSHYAIKKSWKIEILSSLAGNSGGLREMICSISGEKVYAHLKYESGVHRVQRIPQTESQGRIHTSTVTLVVLPLVDKKDITIHSSDIRVDTFRSSGSGGQHVNTTDSAIRIVHLPTKITVQCQDEKSQHANKEKAMKVLYARLYDKQMQEEKSKTSQTRRSQIGRGDRSQKVRTYNFPQSRITDHRTGLTLHNIDGVMRGEIDPFVESLKKQTIGTHV